MDRDDGFASGVIVEHVDAELGEGKVVDEEDVLVSYDTNVRHDCISRLYVHKLITVGFYIPVAFFAIVSINSEFQVRFIT